MNEHVNVKFNLTSEEKNALDAAIRADNRWDKEFRIKHGIDAGRRLFTQEIWMIVEMWNWNARDVIDRQLASKAPVTIDATPIIEPLNVEPPVANVEPPKAPPTPVAPSGDIAGQLAGVIGQIVASAVSPDAVRQIVDERIEKAFRDIPTVNFVVKGSDNVSRDVKGHKHPMFGDLLLAATSRMPTGFFPNILLAGPTGSGKSHAARQLADALGYTFYFTGAVSQDHQLFGYEDANGKYHTTPWREAFARPRSFFCWDEVDRSDPVPLLSANMPLANGYANFPDEMNVARHPDTIFLATANTWGYGPTSQFVGASQLDAAFLSRFAINLPWDYDVAFEAAVSGNEAFAQRVQAARRRAFAAQLQIILDVRIMQAGAGLIANGATSDKAAQMTYLGKLSDEHRKIVEGH